MLVMCSYTFILLHVTCVAIPSYCVAVRTAVGPELPSPERTEGCPGLEGRAARDDITTITQNKVGVYIIIPSLC